MRCCGRRRRWDRRRMAVVSALARMRGSRYGRFDAWLRHNVNRPSGWRWAPLAEDLAMMGPRDALVVMMLGPQLKEMKAILSLCAHHRVSGVGPDRITNLAQARRFSDQVLRCHIASYGLIPTHSTVVSLLRLLAISMSGWLGNRHSARQFPIDDINEELASRPAPGDAPAGFRVEEMQMRRISKATSSHRRAAPARCQHAASSVCPKPRMTP